MKAANHSESFPVLEIPLTELEGMPTLGVRYNEPTKCTFRLKMDMDGFRYYVATMTDRSKVVVDCYLPGSNGSWKTIHEYGDRVPSSGNPPETTQPETAPWEVVDGGKDG